MATPETFCDVFDLLEREEVRYVITSGTAVVLHGHVRSILDLDIVVEATPVAAARALRVLAQGGFVPSIPLPPSMVSVLRMFDQSQREIDVFFRYHVPFEELWSDSLRVQVGRSFARIVSLEHLLRIKRTNGRPHDLLDIEALLALKTTDAYTDNGASVDSTES
ncbi:MAG TPA: hypothetical protein VM095_07685 [Pyrinomonadaceae bacterium]|nr:hypothetical protein [Pyrinomonadaceae bacterium]